MYFHEYYCVSEEPAREIENVAANWPKKPIYFIYPLSKSF